MIFSTLGELPLWLAAHPCVFAAVLFGFGLLIGSFLNVVILRLPPRMEWKWRHEAKMFLADEALDGPSSTQQGDNVPEISGSEPPDLVFPPSRCGTCGHHIKPWENIPVISFLMLGGKCSSCKTRLSWQYPMVELLTGALFVACGLAFGVSGYMLAALIGVCLLIAMSAIDFRTQLLPDELNFPFLWLGLIVAAMGMAHAPSASQAIWGAVVGYLSLWTIFWGFKLLTGKDGMGYGDFKLLAGLGAWCGAKSIISIALLACVMGVIVGVLSIMRGRDRAIPFAFGPYLAMAGIVEILFNGWLWRLLGV
jgi:leader peptidase (prepilin peptidase)/N-methyltransferase